MGMIDLSAKNLMMLDDVFADIINGFIFLGEEKVKEEELTSLSEQSIYDSEDDVLREQRRDLLKLWSKNSCAFALFGIENQDAIDKDMVLRVIGYDGAAYRDQLKSGDKANSKVRYPVITLILYFGEKEWTEPKSLSELFGMKEEYNGFFQDYSINVIPIKHLKAEEITRFKSDFGLILSLLNNNFSVIQKERQIKHYKESLTFISSLVEESEELKHLTKAGTERRFLSMGKTLYDIVEEMKNKEVQEGIEFGKNEGRLEGKIEGRLEGRLEGRNEASANIASEMKKDGFSIEKIMKLTGLSREKILTL